MLRHTEVRFIGKLACLSLSEEEVALYTEQLGKILESFKVLERLDTEGVEPTARAVPFEPQWNEDVPAPSIPFEDWEGLPPKREEGLILVPRIFSS